MFHDRKYESSAETGSPHVDSKIRNLRISTGTKFLANELNVRFSKEIGCSLKSSHDHSEYQNVRLPKCSQKDFSNPSLKRKDNCMKTHCRPSKLFLIIYMLFLFLASCNTTELGKVVRKEKIPEQENLDNSTTYLSSEFTKQNFQPNARQI